MIHSHLYRASRIALARAIRPSQDTRMFHITRPVAAAEDPKNVLSHMQNNPLLQQIAHKPEALAAVVEFAKVMESKGVAEPAVRVLVQEAHL
jgi:hypothetical protein